MHRASQPPPHETRTAHPHACDRLDRRVHGLSAAASAQLLVPDEHPSMHPDAVRSSWESVETETEDDADEPSDLDSLIKSARRAVDSANASVGWTGRAQTETAPSSGGVGHVIRR